MTSEEKVRKLTDSFLRVPPRVEARTEFRDTVQRGLYVRLSPSGYVAFVVKARGKNSKTNTVKLGVYPTLGLKEARVAAAATIARLKDGDDINGEKRGLRHARQASPTLRDLLMEYEEVAKASRKIWQEGGPRTPKSKARSRIECVFEKLLDKRVIDITAENLAQAMRDYKPKRPLKGKRTANGSVSRSRAYLKPVLDWAAGRGRFAKIGAGRLPTIVAADVGQTYDPSTDDATIAGVRERVLDQNDLEKLLPLLTYPAPIFLPRNMPLELDVRPVALMFILLTAARVDEVVSARWRDVHLDQKVWHKPQVKTTKGWTRKQNLPLSNAAVDLLKSLPNAGKDPEGYVFPNAKRGKLGNWTRFTAGLQQAAGLEHFHRHDLRRTAATLMHALNVQASTVDTVLAHTAPFRGENVSDSLRHYVIATQILRDKPDPVREALELLADTLQQIARKGGERLDSRHQSPHEDA